MKPANLSKTNFTAGELSADLLGRGDLRAYENGAARLRNVSILPTGGVRRRAGLAHIDQARGDGRLIAFEFNTEQVYLLVFTDQQVDVYMNGAKTAEITTPWTLAQLPMICWTQSADTLLVVHPDVPPRKITRKSHTEWNIEGWTFHEEKDVIYQPYHKFAGADVTVKPSGSSGSISLTASAPVFDAQHVGRRMRVGGKEVKIESLTSASVVQANVKQNLSSTDETKDWEEEAFSTLRGWPVSVCFHQDRMVIGGSRDLPNRLWLSKSADLFNFDLGEGLDDEAIEFAVLSDQVNAIRAVFSGRHLQLFTSGAEWMVTGAPLTPGSIQLQRQTRIGSPVDRYVPPRDVDGATLFVARNGRELREFIFADIEQAYQATDLALLSRQLMTGGIDQDYDSARRLFHVVMADGNLASVTVFRAESVTAWTGHSTDGAFRAVAVVDDQVYVLVERNGDHFIECFDDSLSTDAALTGESEEPHDEWANLDHLEGELVTILADGSPVARQAVVDGAIMLEHPAKKVEIGLGFTHEIEPLPPFIAAAGGQGATLRLVSASFRLLETLSFRVDTGQGLRPVPFKRFGDSGLLDASPAPFTGDVKVRSIGWLRDKTKPLWRVASDEPLPCTILAVTSEVKGSV